MKHLLTILAVVISATSLGQTADDYLKSGIEKYNSKDFEGAIKDYTKAINANENLKDGYFNRGICEWALQDFEPAKKDLEKTIELDPKFVKAYFDRAIILISQQEYTQALPDLDKTIELDETSTRAFMLRGEIRARSGNNTGACEDFNKAKEMGEPQAEQSIRKFCGNPNEKNIYDSIVSEICSCAHSNERQKALEIVDSCYQVSIKNNYKALQKLGIDSNTLEGQNKLYNEILANNFRLYCEDIEAKCVKEAEEYNASKLTFTGKFISQTLNAEKRYYVIILQSTQTKEKKEFHSIIAVNENQRNEDITVEYEVIKSKKTKKEELVVKSVSAISD